MIIALIIIAIIIALPFVVALFVSKEMNVTREVTINKPVGEVFNYIKYLKNQNEYSKWAQMDPNMKKDFRGTDGTVGFVSAWDSKADSVGAGEQEIAAIKENDRIDYNIHFFRPFDSKAKSHMTTVAEGNQTKVTWAFESTMPYPMNLMKVVMNMDKMLGNDLEIGLSNLKNKLEH